MLSQIIKVIKLLGLRRAARMNKRHKLGLKYIRGYAASSCWWALLRSGFLDELAAHGYLEPDDYAQNHPCDKHVLEAIIEYLHGIGLLDRFGKAVRLSKAGQGLLAEPRGMFELLWAYEPCFANLTEMLSGEKQYGRDLTRRITWVGLGSGRLCEQLPYPVMRRMVMDHGCKMVLDLGCGDMAFLSGLCIRDNDLHVHGIDCSEEMIDYNRERLAKNDFNSRLSVQQGDMFELPELPAGLPEVDCITACDTFHEYLDQEDRIVEMLRQLRQRFPQAIFVIGEFCLQNPRWLRRHPTATLEHHLFHELSRQHIGTADRWRRLFARAGLSVLEEQVYDLIGHGYFALR